MRGHAFDGRRDCRSKQAGGVDHVSRAELEGLIASDGYHEALSALSRAQHGAPERDHGAGCLGLTPQGKHEAMAIHDTCAHRMKRTDAPKAGLQFEGFGST